MKPLILWARNKHPEPYTLRMGKRDQKIVSGAVKIDGDWQPFVYDRVELKITVGEGGGVRIIQINEWGWEQ